ncbi:MAG: BREX-1 system phosphatase PglZ type A, partial [Phycisphaerales bacterium]
MKAEQVDQALHQKFIIEDERLVFWHDQNEEFADYVEGRLAGDLADVQVLDVAEVGGLSTKLRLEREDRTGKYLVYSRGVKPPAEEDWLLDIRLYSAEFHADVASIWRQELGLSSLSLRDYLKSRETFLRSQDRRKKLKRLDGAQEDEATLDLKMMSVLVGSSVASPSDVLRGLCHGHRKEGAFELIEAPEMVATFAKMDLLDRFWEMMLREFEYTSDNPSVAGLLRRLFVSELFHQLDGANLDSLAHHQLPAKGGRNAVVFLTQWRDSSGNAVSYDAAASAVATEQKVSESLAEYDVEAIKDVSTFWEAERRVVSSLKERLLSQIQTPDVESISEIASNRKSGHWLSGPGSDAPDRSAISDAYDAIVAAAEIFALRIEHRNALRFEAPGDLLAAYQKSLYQFDRLYRRFCKKSKTSTSQGWDLLKT